MDILVASAILHDLCKYGIGGEASKIQYKHPELFKLFIETYEIKCPRREIIDNIVGHMGIFSTPAYIKKPSVPLDYALIFSDYIASQEDINIGI
jgi:hypothetical protein